MANTKRVPLADRLWSRVVKTDTCWLYGGKEYGNKYAHISEGGRGGKMLSAHRVSYEQHHGPVPRGKFVCHKCDVKNCVNPDHLYAGTHEDNNRDRVERGRCSHKTARKVKQVLHSIVSDNRHGRALSIDLRKKLIAEYATGNFTQTELAKRYRVSQGTVSATIRGVRNMGGGGDGHAKRTGNYRTKLTEEQKQAIRADYSAGATQKSLAGKYGCHQTYVSILCQENTT